MADFPNDCSDDKLSADLTVLLSDVGVRGKPGLVWRGEWNNTTQYNIGDVVRYENNLYVSTCTTLVGTVPALDPINDPETGNTCWDFLLPGGEDTIFQLEDGDGTEVPITDNKEVKFVEGVGDGASIDINWTDTDTGSDLDPFDLTFTVTNTDKGSDQNIFQTIVSDSGTTIADLNNDTLSVLGGANVSTAIVGDILTISATDTNTNQLTTWNLTADSGGTQLISQGETVNIAGGTNVTTTRLGSTITIDFSDSSQLTEWDIDTDDNSPTTISQGELLTLAGGANVTTSRSGNIVTISAVDTDTTLTVEQVQDIVGGMVTGNVETNISVTYNDAAGTLDFVSVDTDTDTNQLTTWELDSDDNAPTTISQGEEVTIAGGVNVTTSRTGNIITIDAPSTSQATTFQLEDDSGTEVTISHQKEVKFVAGAGLSIVWTDTLLGTDLDPFDMTFTNTDKGSDQEIFKTITSDTGSTTADTNTDTLNIIGGIDIETSIVGDTLTIDHADTSSAGNTINPTGTFVDNIVLDGRGHITQISSSPVTGGVENFGPIIIAPGNTESVNVVATADAEGVKWFITVDHLVERMSFETSANHVSGSVSQTNNSRVGDRIKLKALVGITGLNLSLDITNNESNDISVCGRRLDVDC